eukprot:jgi/Bigna1/79138/fgenesh1_pg.60_\
MDRQSLWLIVHSVMTVVIALESVVQESSVRLKWKSRRASELEQQRLQVKTAPRGERWKNDLFTLNQNLDVAMTQFDEEDKARIYTEIKQALQGFKYKILEKTTSAREAWRDAIQDVSEKEDLPTNLIEKLVQNYDQAVTLHREFLRNYDMQQRYRRWIVSFPGGLNVRKLPETTASVVSAADVGDEITSSRESQSWVFSEKTGGWICRRKRDNTIAFLERITKKSRAWIVVFPGGVNTRMEPSFSSETTGKGLDQGEYFVELESAFVCCQTNQYKNKSIHSLKHRVSMEGKWVRSCHGWVATHSQKGAQTLIESVKYTDMKEWSVQCREGCNVLARPTLKSAVVSKLEQGQKVFQVEEAAYGWIRTAFGWCQTNKVAKHTAAAAAAAAAIPQKRGCVNASDDELLQMEVSRDFSHKLHFIRGHPSHLRRGMDRLANAGLTSTVVKFQAKDGEIEVYALKYNKGEDRLELRHYVDGRFRNLVQSLRFIVKEMVLEDDVTWSGVLPMSRSKSILEGLRNLTRAASIDFTLNTEDYWWLSRTDLQKRMSFVSGVFGFDEQTAPLLQRTAALDENKDFDEDQRHEHSKDPAVLASAKADAEADALLKQAQTELHKERKVDIKDIKKIMQGINNEDPEAFRAFGPKWGDLREVRERLQKEQDKEDELVPEGAEADRMYYKQMQELEDIERDG